MTIFLSLSIQTRVHPHVRMVIGNLNYRQIYLENNKQP